MAAAGRPAAVDKDRRRLSLGVRPDMGDDLAPGGGPGGDVAGTYADQLGGQKCTVIKSKTDQAMARKPTFNEKDLMVEGTTEQPAALKQRLLEGGVAMSCRKGMKPESPNQDSFCIILGEGEGGVPGFRLYCVFDGHGPLGHDISEFVAETLPRLFLRDERRHDPATVEAALNDSFVTCQQLLERKGSISNESGTTCTVAYLPDQDQIWMAHVADSRAVIAKVAAGGKIEGKDLTTDHKPELEGERKRIEAKGGRVVFDGYFNYRVYSREGRGGLNMSRAIGDTLTHAAGVTEVPEVANTRLEIGKAEGEVGRDLFILLCSDGVWEFIPSQEAAEIVMGHGRANVQAAVEDLTQKSYDRWMEDSDGEVSDDITALIVWL